ncbi:MAG: SIS domain-containing protein, partial [Pseudomonadota bacterium]|nr:SIS domain-containing protein [Pseudomonadota bacterium]
MDATARVLQTFQTSAQTKLDVAQIVAPCVAEAAAKLGDVLLAGHKILACGNGGSAADAQHFAGEMLNRFEMERPELPAFALGGDVATLTAIANDYSYDEIYAKQVRALGQSGDALLAISTSGNSRNILQAVAAAHDRAMSVIALTGNDGGNLSRMLSDDDVEICVASTVT